ncbi:uncharacterized protein [Ptychodera flava]|uniref:uncharacterized protein n=1 Tax=Ptychodera flava TaxID=63121 RepID=UPI003969BDD2
MTYEKLLELYIGCSSPEHFKRELAMCKVKSSSRNRISRHFEEMGLEQEGNIQPRPASVLVHPPVRIQPVENPILAVAQDVENSDQELEYECEADNEDNRQEVDGGCEPGAANNVADVDNEQSAKPESDCGWHESAHAELDFSLMNCTGIPDIIPAFELSTPTLIRTGQKSNLFDEDYEERHYSACRPKIDWKLAARQSSDKKHRSHLSDNHRHLNAARERQQENAPKDSDEYRRANVMIYAAGMAIQPLASKKKSKKLMKCTGRQKLQQGATECGNPGEKDMKQNLDSHKQSVTESKQECNDNLVGSKHSVGDERDFVSSRHNFLWEAQTTVDNNRGCFKFKYPETGKAEQDCDLRTKVRGPVLPTRKSCDVLESDGKIDVQEKDTDKISELNLDESCREATNDGDMRYYSAEYDVSDQSTVNAEFEERNLAVGTFQRILPGDYLTDGFSDFKFPSKTISAWNRWSCTPDVVNEILPNHDIRRARNRLACTSETQAFNATDDYISFADLNAHPLMREAYQMRHKDDASVPGYEDHDLFPSDCAGKDDFPHTLAFGIPNTESHNDGHYGNDKMSTLICQSEMNDTDDGTGALQSENSTQSGQRPNQDICQKKDVAVMRIEESKMKNEQQCDKVSRGLPESKQVLKKGNSASQSSSVDKVPGADAGIGKSLGCRGDESKNGAELKEACREGSSCTGSKLYEKGSICRGDHKNRFSADNMGFREYGSSGRSCENVPSRGCYSKQENNNGIQDSDIQIQEMQKTVKNRKADTSYKADLSKAKITTVGEQGSRKESKKRRSGSSMQKPISKSFSEENKLDRKWPSRDWTPHTDQDSHWTAGQQFTGQEERRLTVWAGQNLESPAVQRSMPENHDKRKFGGRYSSACNREGRYHSSSSSTSHISQQSYARHFHMNQDGLSGHLNIERNSAIPETNRKKEIIRNDTNLSELGLGQKDERLHLGDGAHVRQSGYHDNADDGCRKLYSQLDNNKNDAGHREMEQGDQWRFDTKYQNAGECAVASGTLSIAYDNRRSKASSPWYENRKQNPTDTRPSKDGRKFSQHSGNSQKKGKVVYGGDAASQEQCSHYQHKDKDTKRDSFSDAISQDFQIDFSFLNVESCVTAAVRKRPDNDQSRRFYSRNAKEGSSHFPVDQNHNWREEDFDISEILPFKNEAYNLLLGCGVTGDGNSQLSSCHDELIKMYNKEFFEKK